MSKIPVGRTIAHAYGFAFRHYLTALSITWLPALAGAALSFYFRNEILAQMMARTQGNLATVFRLERINLIIQLASLVFGAIISVGITKEVLGLRRGWRFFYAGFGAAELRVIAGYFAMILLFIIFAIGFVIVAAISAGVAGIAAGAAASKGIIAGAGVLAVIAAWFAMIYIFARLTFLFLPATVAERRIGILRSWELTSGNFWRIFVVGLAIVLPFLILAVCIGIATLGTGYVDFVRQHPGEPAAMQQYVADHIVGLIGNPIVLAVNVLLSPVVYGLFISPAAFAYRALMPPPAADAPIAAAPPEPASDLPKEIAEIVDPPAAH